MDQAQAKATLRRYLDVARDSLLWKLEGLSEYDVRRPMTLTGSNLLGIVKHVASVENGYLGDVFGRPSGEALPWFTEDAEANADMWVTPEETREDILGLYERTRVHSDATIEALSLDDLGEVPWWPEDHRQVTLHQILVHITTETHRHAGHADIIRELIDGAAGYRRDSSNLPDGDFEWWAGYRAKIEAAAAAVLESD
ncbi:MAG: DinB family protein [Acidimicrobiia bacterium]|nr:DinB family protein [Acidimicrobiia bacterium]